MFKEDANVSFEFQARAGLEIFFFFKHSEQYCTSYIRPLIPDSFALRTIPISGIEDIEVVPINL